MIPGLLQYNTQLPLPPPHRLEPLLHHWNGYDQRGEWERQQCEGQNLGRHQQLREYREHDERRAHAQQDAPIEAVRLVHAACGAMERRVR